MGTKAQSIREKIITTADDLFYRNGYNHTSFADISKAVGISRGNFYYHFKTKDDILAAVIKNRKTVINDMLQEWNQDQTEPHKRLLCYIDMLMQLKNEIHQHGCPIGSVCTELIKLRNINQLDATEMITLFREWMAKQFMAMGYAKRKSDQLAMHLLSRTQGIAMMANAFSDKSFLISEMEQLKEWINNLCT